MYDHPTNLSDEQLVGEIKKRVTDEYRSLAELLSLLAEMDERRLYAKLGYSSLFVYMVQALHLSEDATYKRIQAARAARKYPVILSLLSEGQLNLSTITLVAPIMTDENSDEILQRAIFKTKREVERMRAEYAPLPDVPDRVQNLPHPTCPGASCICNTEHPDDGETDVRVPDFLQMQDQSSPTRRGAIQPLSEQRVKFQFTGSKDLRNKIERAKTLLRHKYPQAKLEDIIDEALDALLAKRDPVKRIERKEQRGPSQRQQHGHEIKHARYIPQQVKDAVWKRDHGKCQYVAPDGKHCDERGFLEFDHIKPWARGGSSHDPENIRLLCHAHNQLAMEAEFGALR